MCGVLEEFDENRKAGLLVLHCVEPTILSYALFDWLLYAESHFHPSETQKQIFDPEPSSSCAITAKTKKKSLPLCIIFAQVVCCNCSFSH